MDICLSSPVYRPIILRNDFLSNAGGKNITGLRSLEVGKWMVTGGLKGLERPTYERFWLQDEA